MTGRTLTPDRTKTLASGLKIVTSAALSLLSISLNEPTPTRGAARIACGRDYWDNVCTRFEFFCSREQVPK